MHAIVSLRTQYTNLGDLLINILLVSSLAAQCQVICDAAGVPDDYLAEFKAELSARGVAAEFVPSRPGLILRTLRLVAGGQPVVFLLSPGDNLPSRSPQRLVIGLLTRLLPRLFIAQVGASWPAVGGADRFLLRGAAKRPDLLSVRDEASQARLQAVGVAPRIVPDLAFLQPLSHHAGRRFMMTFRERAELPFDALVARLAPLIAAARAAGLVPGFCWQVSSDEALARKLAAACDVEVFQTAPGRTTLPVMRELYHQGAVICSNRLHALLIGAANGALPLACLSAADGKVSAAFAAAGLGSLVAHDPADDARVLGALLQSPEESRHTVETAFAKAATGLHAYFQSMAAAQ
jgi:hypothetical protein